MKKTIAVLCVVAATGLGCASALSQARSLVNKAFDFAEKTAGKVENVATNTLAKVTD